MVEERTRRKLSLTSVFGAWYVISLSLSCSLSAIIHDNAAFAHHVIKWSVLRRLEQALRLAPRGRREVRACHPGDRRVPPRVDRYHRPPPFAVCVLQPRTSGAPARHGTSVHPEILVRGYSELGPGGVRAVPERGVPVERVPETVRELPREVEVGRRDAALACAPIEVDRHRLHDLLEYPRQIRLTLVYEPLDVGGGIVRYHVVRVIPRHAVRETLGGPLVVHDREGRYPASKGIVGAQFVADDPPSLDLIGYEKCVLCESPATRLVLVRAVTGS